MHQKHRIINTAIKLLRRDLREPGQAMTSSATVKNYYYLKTTTLEHETFNVMFLDAQHRLIADETLFTGTINAASVYPREIVKRALALNSAAVILSHNHPSGVSEPSPADKAITTKISQALALIDVNVLDHFIVGHDDVLSFSERGWV